MKAHFDTTLSVNMAECDTTKVTEASETKVTEASVTKDGRDDWSDVGHHWESLDYCLSKTILVEGQSELDWPRLGSKGTIQVTELETANSEREQSEILSTNRYYYLLHLELFFIQIFVTTVFSVYG